VFNLRIKELRPRMFVGKQFLTTGTANMHGNYEQQQSICITIA